jgi:hypothetical protein
MDPTGFSELNLSSQVGQLPSDAMRQPERDDLGQGVRRPTVLNQLNEAIPRVVDDTAEQVRMDFQRFLDS